MKASKLNPSILSPISSTRATNPPALSGLHTIRGIITPPIPPRPFTLGVWVVGEKPITKNGLAVAAGVAATTITRLARNDDKAASALSLDLAGKVVTVLDVGLRNYWRSCSPSTALLSAPLPLRT